MRRLTVSGAPASSGCHRPHPACLPPALKRKGGAAAAQNEEQVAGFERGFRSFDKTLVEAADKSVLGRTENERPAPSCQQRLGWRRHKKKGGTDRRRHRFRITADAGKRTLCFLHAHAGERAHRANDVEQLAPCWQCGPGFRRGGSWLSISRRGVRRHDERAQRRE